MLTLTEVERVLKYSKTHSSSDHHTIRQQGWKCETHSVQLQNVEVAEKKRRVSLSFCLMWFSLCEGVVCGGW